MDESVESKLIELDHQICERHGPIILTSLSEQNRRALDERILLCMKEAYTLGQQDLRRKFYGGDLKL